MPYLSKRVPNHGSGTGLIIPYAVMKGIEREKNDAKRKQQEIYDVTPRTLPEINTLRIIVHQRDLRQPEGQR